MQIYLVVLLVLWSCIGFSQIPDAKNSNVQFHNNSNTNTIVPAIPSTNANDSVYPTSDRYEEIKVESKSVKKEVQSKSSTKAKTFSSAASTESSTQQMIQQKSLELEQVKSKAKYQSNQRTPTVEQKQEMTEKLDELKEVAPESFEYQLNIYATGNYDVTKERHLQKATQMKPNHPEVLRLNAANAWVKGDTTTFNSKIKTLYNNQQLSENWKNYNDDVLKSAQTSKVLVTHGQDDSFTAFYAQNQQVADKTIVVSLELMQSLNYRNLLEKKGLLVPKNAVVDVNFLQNFCQLNANQGVAISMTVPKDYLIPVKEKLFPFGLVFVYGEQNNRFTMQELEELWFQKMNKLMLYSPNSNDLISNYLPTLFYLRNHYKQTGNLPLEQKVNTDIKKIELKVPQKTKSLKKY
jgi:hypothetical protein